MNWDFGWNTLTASLTIVAVLAFSIVAFAVLQRDGAATHHLREVKVAACRTLDDQSARALCIEHA